MFSLSTAHIWNNLISTETFSNTALVSWFNDAFYAAALQTVYIFSLQTTPNTVGLDAAVSGLSVYFSGLTVITIGLLLVAFYCFSFGVKLSTNFTTQVDLTTSVYVYFAELEEEMGSVEDASIYFLLFGALIVWFFFIFVGIEIFATHLSSVIAIFSILAFTAFITPGFVFKNFGLAFTHYVRGGGRTNSLLFEAMLDFVAVAVSMIRFLIQNIRFVFIFSAFFELYEYIVGGINLTSLHLWASTTSNIFAPTANLTAWNITGVFSTLFLQYALYLYYLGHLLVLFVAQLSIYFALSFWLFFFLYTTFTSRAQENYFAVRRINANV